MFRRENRSRAGRRSSLRLRPRFWFRAGSKYCTGPRSFAGKIKLLVLLFRDEQAKKLVLSQRILIVESLLAERTYLFLFT